MIDPRINPLGTLSVEEALAAIDGAIAALARVGDAESDAIFTLADLRTRLQVDIAKERDHKTDEELSQCRVEMGVSLRYVYEVDGVVAPVADLVGGRRKPLERGDRLFKAFARRLT